MLRERAGRALALASGLALSAGAVALGAMALIGAADVLADNLAGRPIPSVSEFASDYLPAVILLAAAAAQRERADIVVDILVTLLPGGVRRGAGLLAVCLTIVFLGALTWGAWQLALASIALGEVAVAAVQYPVWPAKLAFALGLTVATLEAVRLLVTGRWENPAHIPAEAE